MNFFDVRKSIEAFPEAITHITIGARGVGKTYSIQEFTLEDSIVRDRQFCVVGRFKEDVMPSALSGMFGAMCAINRHTGKVPLQEIVAKAKGIPPAFTYSIMSRAGVIWLAGVDEDGKATAIKQIGVYTSIQTAERFKRGSYPNVYNIFFDEFITSRYYITGASEPKEFEKIVNTIFRGGKNGKIFMAGNPDNEIDLNPYMTAYNIFYDDMEPNTIYPFNGGKVAIVKLTNDSEEFIVKDTVSMFGVRNMTAFTGEVDRPETTPIPDDFAEKFSCVFEVKVETPGIMVDSDPPHRKCFFLYFGLYKGVAYIVTREHHASYKPTVKIVSKYSDHEMPPCDPRGEKLYIYRFNFPRTWRFNRDRILECIRTGHELHENDKTGNMLHNML